MNFVLAAYDIPDNKRRLKVANVLEDYGQRVQMSVFEVWLDDRLRRELLSRLRPLLDVDEDSVRLYALCDPCRKRLTVLGRGEPPEPPGAIIL